MSSTGTSRPQVSFAWWYRVWRTSRYCSREATAARAVAEGPLLQPEQVHGVKLVGVDKVVEQNVGSKLVEPPAVTPSLGVAAAIREVSVAPGLDEEVAGRPLLGLHLAGPD